MGQVSGKIKIIGETVTFASGFSKRLLVVTTEDKYPQDIAIDFPKEKGDLLNSVTVGQEVEVGYNLRGSEHQGKYYVSLSGWKLNAGSGGKSSGQVGGSAAAPAPSPVPSGDIEDSPF